MDTTSFKNGDRIRLNTVGGQANSGAVPAGATGKIKTDRPDGHKWWWVIFDNPEHEDNLYAPSEMELLDAEPAGPDMVNHPPHYKQYPVEVIQITEHLNFCKGNAVKYILRAEHKGNEIQDLEKARWYLDREIARLSGTSD